jgi:hypothetical protein
MRKNQGERGSAARRGTAAGRAAQHMPDAGKEHATSDLGDDTTRNPRTPGHPPGTAARITKRGAGVLGRGPDDIERLFEGKSSG